MYHFSSNPLALSESYYFPLLELHNRKKTDELNNRGRLNNSAIKDRRCAGDSRKPESMGLYHDLQAYKPTALRALP